MAIQEFLIEEVKNIVSETEDLTSWKEMVEKLNFEGQRQLQAGDNRSPIPFIMMNRAMVHTYETLCPSKALAKNYNKTTIPLRVLALIFLCQEQEYFGKIEIWYADTTPCPIVVGCDGEDKYLVARWGDELEEFDILQKKAIEIKKESRLRTLEIKMIEIQRDIKSNDLDVEGYMKGETGYLY